MTETTATSTDAFVGWSQDRINALNANRTNGHVGSKLVSETDRVRVWHLKIPPYSRFGFHAHVLNYFWTALVDGQGRSHCSNGAVKNVTYKAGDTKHLEFAEGEGMQHDLENTSDSDLVFVTVEFKDSPNAPLPL
jgi:hypothetical protein